MDVHAALVLRRRVAGGWPAGAAAQRGAAPRRGEDYVAAEIRSLEQVVLPTGVRRELREPRMDHGAVQAFGEVLEDELPVGPHVVVGAAAGAKAGGVGAP